MQIWYCIYLLSFVSFTINFDNLVVTVIRLYTLGFNNLNIFQDAFTDLVSQLNSNFSTQIRIRIPNTDSKPATHMNTVPHGSGFATLLTRVNNNTVPYLPLLHAQISLPAAVKTRQASAASAVISCITQITWQQVIVPQTKAYR